ncbi:TrbM/KikA/MpfK family conjugal transfer protein [Campylobacter fetus]|uniref:TrbM/KikA/MpfK family conjugal transfer protein n=1 Tax=Campylobacter fetus TaxID=196 RepID=UPI003AF78E25
MKKLFLFLAFCFSANLFAVEPDILTGDRKTACEVLLCLSSGTRPAECNPPLARFFSIKFKKPWKTLQARRDFLKLCPTDTGDTAEDLVMSDYKEILANYEDPNQCTPPYLNRQLQNGRVSYSLNNKYYEKQGYKNNIDNGVRINPNMPSFCYALINHQYTDLKMPRYNCSGEFYTQTDWQNGYRLNLLGIGSSHFINSEPSAYTNLPNNEKHKITYHVDNNHAGYYVTEYYQIIRFNKTCWSY